MSDESFPTPLVDAAWLRTHAGHPKVRVFDVRWYLQGKRGRDEYARGHLPGAAFLDLDEDLAAREGPGRHPLPKPEDFQRALRRAGLRKGDHVVAYDDAGGSIAARLWWMLEHWGHASVSVLDGGLQAWLGAGGELDTAAVTPSEGDWEARALDRDDLVDRAELGGLLATPPERFVLLDARAGERYRGELEPVDARPGHIPGAKSAPWAGNLREGRFLEHAALRERFAALGVETDGYVVAYCGSGVTACHDLLALRLAGLGFGALYEGSWSDWARQPELPARLGPEP